MDFDKGGTTHLIIGAAFHKQIFYLTLSDVSSSDEICDDVAFIRTSFVHQGGSPEPVASLPVASRNGHGIFF